MLVNMCVLIGRAVSPTTGPCVVSLGPPATNRAYGQHPTKYIYMQLYGIRLSMRAYACLFRVFALPV